VEKKRGVPVCCAKACGDPVDGIAGIFKAAVFREHLEAGVTANRGRIVPGEVKGNAESVIVLREIAVGGRDVPFVCVVAVLKKFKLRLGGAV